MILMNTTSKTFAAVDHDAWELAIDAALDRLIVEDKKLDALEQKERFLDSNLDDSDVGGLR